MRGLQSAPAQLYVSTPPPVQTTNRQTPNGSKLAIVVPKRVTGETAYIALSHTDTEPAAVLDKA